MFSLASLIGLPIAKSIFSSLAKRTGVPSISTPLSGELNCASRRSLCTSTKPLSRATKLSSWRCPTTASLPAAVSSSMLPSFSLSVASSSAYTPVFSIALSIFFGEINSSRLLSSIRERSNTCFSSPVSSNACSKFIIPILICAFGVLSSAPKTSISLLILSPT